MKTTRILFFSAVSVIAVLGAEPSEAGTRWRVDGNICRPYIGHGDDSNWFANPRPDGLEVYASGGMGGMICPLPMGESLVLTNGTAPGLSTVHANFHVASPGAYLDSWIVLNDYTSSSTCTCGDDDMSANPGYRSLVMPFDCGACSFGANWPGNIQIEATYRVQPAWVKLKRIVVTDF